MEQLNLNKILNRTKAATLLKQKLIEFEKTKQNISVSRGFYVYGNPGVGKTKFVINILKDLNYSIIKYDASDIRNKSIINKITKHNISDKSVLSMFGKKHQPMAIIMDEIDGMNSGDRGGITALIKLIRAKKTKKQKKEDVTMIPIICIGNTHTDKKIKELIKVCTTILLEPPSRTQIKHMLGLLLPSLDNVLRDNLLTFISGDLRKLLTTLNIYNKQQHLLKQELIQNIFQSKTNNEDTKEITKGLLNKKVLLKDHNLYINETDRTSVSLLFHENIIDVLPKTNIIGTIPTYLDMLNNICYADYIDRITFQKQIWIFNEISSLMKTIHNNNIYHDTYNPIEPYNPTNVRFTKVLTKYSTEYNNSLFIQSLCQKLSMDKDDMLSYFLHIREEDMDLSDMIKLFDHLEINKLDINRIYRFIDRHTLDD